MKKEKTYKTLHLCIDEEYVELIDKVKRENFLDSRSKAVNLILKEYASLKDPNMKNISNDMKKMKMAVNSVNKDTQIILQLLNGIYYREEYGIIPDVNKNPTKPYTDSVERVETKIAMEQYKKNKSLD